MKIKKMGTLIQEVRIYSQRIGMEFGIEKYAILVIKSGSPSGVVCHFLLRKICHTSNKKWQTTPDGCNGTTKLKKK